VNVETVLDSHGKRLRYLEELEAAEGGGGGGGTFSGALAFTWVILEPIPEDVGQIRIPWECRVIRVDGNVLAGMSCAFNIEERDAPGIAGTNILTVDMTATVGGTSVIAGFNNSSLGSGNYLTVDISAVTGNVDYLSITLTVVVIPDV